MLVTDSAPATSGIRGVAAPRGPRRRWPRLLIGGGALAVWLGMAWWQTHKPLPRGEHIVSPWHPLAPHDVRFIADVTAADAYGRPVVSHAVFDQMLQVVRAAREFVVIDVYRFEQPLAARLADALAARKRADPGLRILLILDPAGTASGARSELARLEQAGVGVVATDLDPLRDSNFLYSSLWRLAARWWASDALAARLAAANLKADRRNIVIGDDGQGGLAGVLSATELSEAGRADSNIGMRLSGPVLEPLLASEVQIARFSGWTGVLGIPTAPAGAAHVAPPGADPATLAVSSTASAASGGASAGAERGASRESEARVLTEGAIQEALLRRIGGAGAGDAIDIAAFYLSDRAVIESLIAASRRGAAVRLILDPAEDAFGRDGAGIPNRSVAGELLAASDGAIRVRWYRTHGERYHASLAMVYGPERLWLTVGSANLTRRSLDDYDLDANAALVTSRDSPLATQAIGYFETLWSNRAGLGIEYTADVGVYADASQLHYWRYRLMEATGLSLF